MKPISNTIIETGNKAVMNKVLILMISLLGSPGLYADTDTIDIQSHDKGIWSINGTEKEQRWLVIHNLADGKKTGIYHIEVIQKATGAPSWRIEHLARHMAITETALIRSVVKPLSSGAVYPEAFDDALAEWQAENGGNGGEVCRTSVIDCIAK